MQKNEKSAIIIWRLCGNFIVDVRLYGFPDTLLAKNLHDNLLAETTIKNIIHSSKFRPKSPDSLKKKLIIFAQDAKRTGKSFDITKDNLFIKINDLAGVRLIHLHTKQMQQIHQLLISLFDEHKYTLVKKPTAFTWDEEHADFFKSIGLVIEKRNSLYTSIHYVLESNRRTRMRCEVQVRTLVEELWGEVSHRIDYPCQTESVACKEQIAALAKIANGCTRLVDSIFASHKDYLEKQI